jgi:hypothetical protein
MLYAVCEEVVGGELKKIYDDVDKYKKEKARGRKKKTRKTQWKMMKNKKKGNKFLFCNTLTALTLLKRFILLRDINLKGSQ